MKRRTYSFLGTKTCEHCGTTFSHPPHWPSSSWRRARFCSRSCVAQNREGSKDRLAAFFDAMLPEPNSGCWLWTGTVNKGGYGQISIRGKLHLAHRLSYELHKGPIPDGLFALHHCDTRCCTNPDHLYPGTPADNGADMARRDRSLRGERSQHAKLTDDDVRAIKAADGTNADIARRFGISRPVVQKIRTNLAWRHVR